MVDINKKQFENLCKLQCDIEEIASWFDCETTDVQEWCDETYGVPFEEIFEQKAKAGLISLRRAQFKLAERSAPMAMFLGRQYLGQTDNGPSEQTIEEGEDDGDDIKFLAAIITGAARPTG